MKEITFAEFCELLTKRELVTEDMKWLYKDGAVSTVCRHIELSHIKEPKPYNEFVFYTSIHPGKVLIQRMYTDRVDTANPLIDIREWIVGSVDANLLKLFLNCNLSMPELWRRCDYIVMRKNGEKTICYKVEYDEIAERVK